MRRARTASSRPVDRVDAGDDHGARHEGTREGRLPLRSRPTGRAHHASVVALARPAGARRMPARSSAPNLRFSSAFCRPSRQAAARGEVDAVNPSSTVSTQPRNCGQETCKINWSCASSMEWSIAAGRRCQPRRSNNAAVAPRTRQTRPTFQHTRTEGARSGNRAGPTPREANIGGRSSRCQRPQWIDSVTCRRAAAAIRSELRHERA
jgi:hypothetical protein